MKKLMNNITSFREFRKRKAYSSIDEWNTYAQEEQDIIKKFIFRWIAFNGLHTALYSMKFGQEETEDATDNTKINYFLDNFILTKLIPGDEICSDSTIKIFKSEIKRNSRGMMNLLGKLDDEKKIEEKTKVMIQIAYKIRCRLFHGEKNPLLDVNEIVCSAADKVITPVLNFIQIT